MGNKQNRFGPGVFNVNPLMEELSECKNFSQFKIRADIAGIESGEPKFVYSLISLALKKENYVFLDVFAEIVKNTNFFDAGIKKYWKSFLKMCGTYISRNYTNTNRSYFMAMCGIVSAVRNKYPHIVENVKMK